MYNLRSRKSTKPSNSKSSKPDEVMSEAIITPKRHKRRKSIDNPADVAIDPPETPTNPKKPTNPRKRARKSHSLPDKSYVEPEIYNPERFEGGTGYEGIVDSSDSETDEYINSGFGAVCAQIVHDSDDG